MGVPLGYLPRFEFKARRAQRTRRSQRSSLHDLDLIPARRLHEGPTPPRPTQRHSLKTRKTQESTTPARNHANMIPLIPTLALAFVSFICSAFVILRILIPILPPHPLSRRVPPVSSLSDFIVVRIQLTIENLTQSEFGLPNYRSISPADKSHLWLAFCDVLALVIFTWQAVNEFLGGPSGYSIINDPASAVRLWFAMTLRQTCLLIISGLTLLHVRMGRPVSFGGKHWMLWAPTLILVVTSTALAGVLAATSAHSLFVGLVAYSTSVSLLSTLAFGCLVGTLVIIKHNLAALDDIRDPWPPAKVAVEERPRPSFAAEDVNALKDSSSWITSHASSRHDSISAFSFSTHHTVRTHSRAASNSSTRMLPHPVTASYPSIAPKSSYWFNPATPFGSRESVPPVPPLPAPYRPTSTTSAQINDDPDPFKRPVPRMGSQSSWLTEPSQYQPTLSNWSFPATQPPSPPPTAASLPMLGSDLLPSTAVSRPTTPAMANAEVLGGYGYNADSSQEKGFNSFSSTASRDLDMTVFRTAGWLVMIWVPQVCGYISDAIITHLPFVGSWSPVHVHGLSRLISQLCGVDSVDVVDHALRSSPRSQLALPLSDPHPYGSLRDVQ